MPKNKSVQYTIRSVPADVDRALRKQAARENTSLNQVVLDVLRRTAAPNGNGPVYHDLDDCIGTWQEDPAVDEALAAQDRVDRALWR